MQKKNSLLLVLAIAMFALLGTTQGALGVETPLTDYSRAVMLDNPAFYWTFNEAGATDAANEVMRWETQSEMIACVNATRTASYSTELGNAASLDGGSAFWCKMLDRFRMSGANAVEFWIQSNEPDSGYVLNFLGEPAGGNEPGVIMGFLPDQMELFYVSGSRTAEQTPLQVNDNTWHHIVLAVYGDDAYGVANRIDVAVDGTVSTLYGLVDSRPLNIAGALSVGACFPSQVEDPIVYTTGDVATSVWDGFQGNIDELAVYDLADMTEAEVSAKLNDLAGHYALATNPVAIEAFTPVPCDEVTYTHIGGNVPYPSYDDTGSEISDGLYAGNSLTENSVVGYQGTNGYVDLEFDLGEVRTLDAIWVDYFGSGHRNGVDSPESAEVRYSTDGVNFTTMDLFEDFQNEYINWGYCEHKTQIDMGDVDARYVRIRFNNWDKTDEGGDKSNFVFLSEVQFMELASTPQIAGDANNDGKVDGSDVTILANNWQHGVTGTPNATWEMGDFNGDGMVDGSDVTILANNWQYGVTTAAAAVPEPSTILLLFAGVVTLLAIRRRK